MQKDEQRFEGFGGRSRIGQFGSIDSGPASPATLAALLVDLLRDVTGKGAYFRMRVQRSSQHLHEVQRYVSDHIRHRVELAVADCS